MAKAATEKTVELEDLITFIRPRNNWVMSTFRRDGLPQISPVAGGVGDGNQLLVSTYPSRDKVHNIERDPRVSICVLSDHFGGSWVQVDGRATVTRVPEAVDGLVEYFRSISGEHPDWDEYRAAMLRQGKCLISVEIDRWGPVATGGFPPAVIPLLKDQ
jgi:PPOX class probable F420-dependent enzyme